MDRDHKIKLIGVLGKAGAGKDEVSRIIKQFGFTQLAFADGIKKQISELLGCSITDIEKYKRQTLKLSVESCGWSTTIRNILQKQGMFMRKGSYNYWIDQLAIEMIDGNKYVISDVRMDNEIQFILNKRGILIYVNRDIENEFKDHPTEIMAENDRVPDMCDFVIDNNGTIEELNTAITFIMKELGYEQRNSN